MLSRRTFVQAAIGGNAAWLLNAKSSRLKIGVMDTVFKMPGKSEAVRLAKKLGLAGVQVTVARRDFRRLNQSLLSN